MAKKKAESTNTKALAPVLDLPGGLNQPVQLDNPQNIVTQIDNIVNYAVDQQMPDYAMDLISNLVKLERYLGIAKSRAIWLLSRRWAELGMMDVFEDVIIGRTGYDPDTIRRHLLVGEAMNSISDVLAGDQQTLDKLFGRHWNDWVAIAQARNRHGEFTKKQLQSFSNTTDTGTLRKRIQKVVTGREDEEEVLASDGQGRTLFLKRDGTLMVQNGRKREPLGVLYTTPEKLSNDLIAWGINRVIEGAGIQQDAGAAQKR